jgi:hypothetical protein
MSRVGSLAATLSVAAAVALVFAAPATATFHLMSIREVYPGSLAEPQTEYVELQMYASGQTLVEGHVLRTFNAAGTLVKANVLPTDVGNGVNQATILIATPEAEAHFGVEADAPLAPSGQLDPGGGAVCWESLDCVSWGNFSGSLASPAGQPAEAGGIPDGMALRRTIAPNCPTLLDSADDSNNSAGDFSAVFPGPRPNSAMPPEHPCKQAGAPTQQPTAGAAPGTRLKRKPPKRTADRTATFRFDSSESDASFLCQLDRRPFKPCRSPFTTRRLGYGHHAFRVKALGADGAVDPTPARYGFTVVAA